jgi:hypothetical protein
VLGSIPSDHATAAPTLVATIHQRRTGNTRQRYKQSAWAAPSIAPSTVPASTMATRVGNGPQEAPVTATPTAAGTLKPIASPSVTTSTHRTSRMTVSKSTNASSQVETLVGHRRAKVLLRNDGDWAGGPIKYGTSYRADPAGPFSAAVGTADDQQLHVSRHRAHGVAGRTG